MNELKIPIKNYKYIRGLIPQKEPIIMVDSLLYFDDGKVISGFKIKNNNIFLNKNVLSESGLIENMAQTVALYTGYKYRNEAPKIGFIGAIRNLIIYELPKLNDIITTEINILHDIMGIVLIKGITKNNNKIIMEARLKTALKK
jgi:predicted hotdog family 3-hydroxylacyl-ACP dehydratase